MKTFVTVDFRGYAALLVPPRTASARVMGGFQALANREGVSHWKDNFLPRRFLPGNKIKYKHQPRKLPYRTIKEKLGRGEAVYIRGQRITERVQRSGVVNIVRSGRTENMARRSSAIASYPSRASVRLQVAGAVARRPGPGKPDMKMEILTTPADEREELRQVIAKKFRELLLEYAAHRRIKV